MAEKLLIEQKEFYPFGASIDCKDILIPSGFFGGDDFPLSENVVNSLGEYFEKQLQQGAIKAYAVTYDVQVTNKKFTTPIDAVTIRIIHQDNENIIVYYFPYNIENEKVTFLDSWTENE
jgi:hypothetical protein